MAPSLSDLPYEDRLHRLKLPTLENRRETETETERERERGDLTLSTREAFHIFIYSKIRLFYLV